MSVRFYMDVHVQKGVTGGLRLRGVDVVTAQEDEAAQMADPDLLERATALDRVLFTQDEDFLKEAGRRQQFAIQFAGVVYCSQLALTIGQIIRDLEIIAKAADPVDLADKVEYLPL
jgi:predicted nuclease of predicted toxin-antitoxin system